MNFFPRKLAKKYIFSGANATEVNVISWIAFLALGFVSACLILILSIFSGLEELNLKFFSDINPDLVIHPKKGKWIPSSKKLEQLLKQEDAIFAFTPTIEGRSFATYQGKNHILNIKGVGPNIKTIFPLDTMVRVGNYLNFDYEDEIIIGTEVSNRLSLFLDDENPVTLYTPKPGKGIIQSQADAFFSTQAFNTGLFFINNNYDNHAFASLGLAQKLFGLDSTQYSSIEIKVKPETNVIALQKKLRNRLGKTYTVKTRKEIDAAFLKMMNTENLVVYLILFLVLCIASFNLAGSIAILILDKRKESHTLWALGMKKKQIQQTFFYTGLYISLYGLLVGLGLGTLLAWLQQSFGFYTISTFVPFPVRFTWQNYAVSIASVLAIGLLVSYFVSRKAAQHLVTLNT